MCDKAYVMGRAIGFRLRTLVESGKGEKNKKSANRENIQEGKLKKEKKEMRQIVAKKKQRAV